MSASKTAFPRMRAATAIEMEEDGGIPVFFSINTRTNATMCKATKKKIVGGSNLKNSSFSFFMSGAFGGRQSARRGRNLKTRQVILLFCYGLNVSKISAPHPGCSISRLD